jgi:hypothetical protein
VWYDVIDREKRVIRGYNMAKCHMCFQDKQGLTPIAPKSEVVVCKSCGYKLQQVTGFFEFHGYLIQRYMTPVPDIGNETEPSPEATKSKKSPS